MVWQQKTHQKLAMGEPLQSLGGMQQLPFEMRAHFGLVLSCATLLYQMEGCQGPLVTLETESCFQAHAAGVMALETMLAYCCW
mmetsp:Transcript_13255/g.19390  ORF Transcript_13255/g.19390 Transcript_13255/m.19390 type:complete len:83 (+) Transcript_13255:347-595(+)